MSLQKIIVLAIVLSMTSCTKKQGAPEPDPVPFSFSIDTFKDSLTLIPINFSATANQTADLYTWDFGDSTTATGRTSSHIYKKMGNYPINCYAKSGGQTYVAYTILHVKGDGRIIGPRHFSAILYKTSTGDVIVNDTILNLRAPGAYFLTYADNDNQGFGLYTESATQVVYANTLPPYKTYINYFPANDSIYISYSGGDPLGGAVVNNRFMSKKR